MESNKGRSVEIREDVAVEDEKGVVHAGLLRREADCPGGVEGLGLDDVLEGDTGDLVGGERLSESVRPVAEGEHRTVDPVTRRPFHHVHDHGPLEHKQHLLGNLVCKRPKSGPLAADENDGVHQPVVVVVLGDVVVVEVALLPAVVVVVVVELEGLVVVVVVVVGVTNTSTAWAPGGRGTTAPFATKASM